MTGVTIVVPLFDEAESLDDLHAQLSSVAERHQLRMRMIFVDDGSSDGSWRCVEQLAAKDERVLGIRFRRNFGKAAALSAGFEAAEDEFVITMDADLQDDPEEVPRLLAMLRDDAGQGARPLDVVSGWKQTRHDPIGKRWPSLLFNGMVSKLTGVRLHDHNCGLKAYRRDVLHEVRLYGELHRFVPVLAAARGYRVGEMVVNHRPRRFGKSKYGVTRMIKGLLDLLTVKFLTGYGDRPQHLLGSVGLGAFFLGGLAMFFLAVRWCLSRTIPGWEAVHLHETAALYYSFAMLLIGAQFLSVGLLGEMITAFLARDVDMYSIAEHTSPAGSTQPASMSGQSISTSHSSAANPSLADPSGPASGETS
ncbi:MAG: glycosyltransferase family 2 protein [Planctomycetota bacterium]